MFLLSFLSAFPRAVYPPTSSISLTLSINPARHLIFFFPGFICFPPYSLIAIIVLTKSQQIPITTKQPSYLLNFYILGTVLSMSHYLIKCNILFKGSKTLLEKAMAPHSSTLAWKIPWTEGPGRLQSMGSLRVGHD